MLVYTKKHRVRKLLETRLGQNLISKSKSYMTGPCMVSVLSCGQVVTGIVSGRVYNVNSWILNVHLQFSVVVPVIFVLKLH